MAAKRDSLNGCHVLAVACAGVAMLLGLSALIGWHTYSPVFIQFHPSFKPMDYETALGFVLCGISFWCLSFDCRKSAMVCGLAVLALGLLSAMGRFLGAGFQLSSLVMLPHLQAGAPPIEHMSLHSAASFVVVGTVLLGFVASPGLKHESHWMHVSGFSGGIILVCSLVILYCYGFWQFAGFQWFNEALISVPTAVCFAALSSSVIVLSGERVRAWDRKSPAWITMITGIITMSVVLGIWLVCLAHENPTPGKRYVLPEATLLVGVVLSVLLTLAVHAAHKARMRARDLKLVNDELSKRVFELERAREKVGKLSTVVDQAAEGVMITDLRGTIQYVNPAFESITGYSPGEVIGRTPNVLKSGQHDPAFYRTLWESLEKGEIWRGRMMNRKKTGELYEQEASIAPVKDASGITICYAAVMRDVTVQVELERGLRQVQKMDAIGQLAGGIAHDFNNILASVAGYARLAQDQITAGSEAHDDLQQVLNAADRGREMVNQILTYSRQSHKTLIRHPEDLGALIKDSMKLLRPAIPSTIEMSVESMPELSRVVIDRTQFHQVLMNLCVNASHAMPSGGRISIKLEKVCLSEEDSWKFLEPSGYRLKPGDYVLLTVEDTGVGIEKSVLPKIFDPFFTTKKDGEGTGMGLSVVYGIIKDHKGGIRVYSEVGKGTSFKIYLPTTRTRTSVVANGNEPVRGGNESILVVDDEEMLAKMIEKSLVKLGYRVTTTSSGFEALGIFKKSPEKFDLVVVDQTMPKISGDQLAQEMIGIRPDIPVVICSGFSKVLTLERLKEIKVRKLINKPFIENQLEREIRRILDDQPKKPSA